MLKRGIPAAAVCSTPFVPAARRHAQTLGFPDLPIIELGEQVGHASPAELQIMAKQVVDVVPDLLRKYQSNGVKGQSRQAAGSSGRAAESTDPLDIDAGTDLADRVNRLFLQENWTDGLPVIVPTEDHVEGMLKTVSASPDEVLGVFRPRGGVATVSKVAVCAVMAGCLPKHFPIVVAAVRAIAKPEFKMGNAQSTGHPRSPLIIVNGPAAIEAGLSNGHDLTAKAWQANMVICRAVRLVTINMCGLKDAPASHTPGYLGRITDCVRENEEESPWAPYHTDAGYTRDASTVTVFVADPPHVIDDRGSTTPQSMLTTFARVMATGGNRSAFTDSWQLILMGPEHASYLDQHGFSKEDVREFLFHVARIPLHEFPQDNMDSFSKWRKKMFANVSEHVGVPVCRDKEDIKIFVHGGTGPHSLYFPGTPTNKVVTVPIERKL